MRPATAGWMKKTAQRDGRSPAPVQVLWSGRGPLAAWYDTLAIWRDWAEDVIGQALDCGHFLAEEKPVETLANFAASMPRVGRHLCELIWDVERHQAPEHLKSAFPNRPQRHRARRAAAPDRSRDGHRARRQGDATSVL